MLFLSAQKLITSLSPGQPLLNASPSSLVRDPPDFEIIAIIASDQDLGMVAAVSEDREHVTRSEGCALDGCSGVGKAFEVCRGDLVEVNHAHVGKLGFAPGVQGGRNRYMPEDIRAASDHGAVVEVKQPATGDGARAL